MLWGAPEQGMHVGCPRLCRTRSPGLTACVGLEIVLESRLQCSYCSAEVLAAQKSSRTWGRSPGGCGAGTMLLPLVSGIREQRFPGRISPWRRAAVAGRAVEANFAEWLFFKNNSAFVSRSGLLQIE